MRLFHCLIILLLCFVKTAFSQAIDKEKLDAYLKTLEVHQKWMGSVALMKAGNIVYQHSTGFNNFETRTLADQNTTYRIGSISKTITATLVLKAVEEKRLSLDDKLALYYPNILHADSISIRHLLTHRSGIHNYTDDSTYLQWHTKPHSEKEMLLIIQQGGSDFMPGTKTSYSNANYYLLACILQRVYNQSYEKMLTNKITKPIGLTNTFSGMPIQPDKNDCYSYTFLEDWTKQPETHLSVALGGGSVVSTPTDLVRFADALFSGKIISRQSLNQMKTMQDGFGFGLFAVPFYEKQGFGHTGGIDGFSSVFYYFPEDSIAFAMTSNGSNYDDNTISIAALSAVYNKPFSIPVFNQNKPNADLLEKYEGVYTSETIPLQIMISKKDTNLYAQGSGQPAIMLEYESEHRFSFAKANLVLVFNLADNTMLLKQGGIEAVFKKQ